jgi:hypothetical protein
MMRLARRRGILTVNLTMTDITEAGRNPGRILGLKACLRLDRFSGGDVA